MQIDELPGVEPRHAESLASAGIRTCLQLLRIARYPDRLACLSQASKLPVALLRELTGRAELSLVQGIGPANLACLVAAGILSSAELASQEPQDLRLRLSQVMPRPPNLAVVEHWIAQARRRARSPGREEPPAPGTDTA